MKKNQKHLTLKFFLQECQNALGFLTTEYKFSKPKIVKESNFFDVTFYKNHLAIRCNYDLRDDMASPLRIVKLTNGKKPDCWRVNKNGEVVEEYLITLLIARGVRKLGFDIIVDDKDISRSQTLLRKFLLSEAMLIKTYGQDILNDSTEIFNNLSPEDGDMF